MFVGSFVVAAVLAASCAAALLWTVQMFKDRPASQRADAGARILVAGALAGTVLGWGQAFPWAPGAVLAAALLWSLGRAGRCLRHREPGAAIALYRSGTALLAGWVLLAAARSGISAAAHPAHQLGVILVDLLAAVAMAVAAAGWLLAAFATPAQEGKKPVVPLAGTSEALLSLGLAVALYAIS